MKTQIKTLFASFLLLIALCFGAFASVGEKHALGDFGTAQQYVGQNPEAIQLVSLGNFTSSAKSTAECCNATNNLLPPNIKNLSEVNITNSGETVLGHFPGYIDKANSKGASFFDIGNAWDDLTPNQRWAANTNFLDTIAAKGDTVNL